jgi:hypothetical protein
MGLSIRANWAGGGQQDIAVPALAHFYFDGQESGGFVSPIQFWFDEYSPDPPYTYVKSFWLATVSVDSHGYFTMSPAFFCYFQDTGLKDSSGNTIWALIASNLGEVWRGIIRTNLGFHAQNQIAPITRSNTATVAPQAPVVYSINVHAQDKVTGKPIAGAQASVD